MPVVFRQFGKVCASSCFFNFLVLSSHELRYTGESVWKLGALWEMMNPIGDPSCPGPYPVVRTVIIYFQNKEQVHPQKTRVCKRR